MECMEVPRSCSHNTDILVNIRMEINQPWNEYGVYEIVSWYSHNSDIYFGEHHGMNIKYGSASLLFT